MADTKFTAGDVEQVWYRDSDVPGPTALILGGVHGDERAGVELVRNLISGEFEVPLERGRLIVALGNLAAIEAGVRFVDTNLNREFKTPTDLALEEQDANPSYEFSRAQALIPVLDEAGAALDLHGFRALDGKPFIITEERGFPVARALGAGIISSGWSSIEPGGTDGYMDSQGKIGLCYELSPLADVANGVPRGERGVLRFLEHIGVNESSGKLEPQTEPMFVHATNAVLARPGFAWGPNYPYASFQPLEAGELVAHNGPSPEDDVVAGKDQVIIFPSTDRHPNPNDEMFNLGTVISPSLHR